MKLFKLIRACIVFNLPLRSYHITMHLWQRALRACFHVTIVSIVGRIFNDRSLSSSFCLKCQLPVLIGYETRDITCEGQKHSFVSNKICLPSIISIVTNNIRFNLLQLYPSMLLFVFALSFIPSPNFLSGYFNVSLNLMAVLNVWILIHFVTQLQVFKPDSRAIVCHSYQGLPATIIIISTFNETIIDSVFTDTAAILN